jgi:predicted RNA-binding Zn ribbon-like protein
MRMPATDPRALRFDGGAPWLDLLATEGWGFGPTPVERLATSAVLAAWLEREGLTPTGPPPDEDDLRAARELRDALGRAAHAVVAGAIPDVGDLDIVQDHAPAGAMLALRVRPTLERVAPRDTQEALGRLARSALEDLTGPVAGELRSCGAPDCRMLFRDPGGRRRWCDPSGCGTRTRVRAYRDRHRAQM